MPFYLLFSSLMIHFHLVMTLALLASSSFEYITLEPQLFCFPPPAGPVKQARVSLVSREALDKHADQLATLAPSCGRAASMARIINCCGDSCAIFQKDSDRQPRRDCLSSDYDSKATRHQNSGRLLAAGSEGPARANGRRSFLHWHCG